MARPIRPLAVTAEQRRSLQSILRKSSASQREVRRARIVLLRGDGLSQQTVAQQAGVNRHVVAHWEKRFMQGGIAGLRDARRSGRKPIIAPEIKAQIISEATRPPPGHTQWSTRKMARAKGVGSHTVQTLWKTNDIKPHLKRAFKLSNDKNFEAKFWDVIGLYLDPPDRALILCCDEPERSGDRQHREACAARRASAARQQSRCQALERTQPGPPLGLGHVRTATHDHVRHGTLTLFAALSYLDGKVFRQTAGRHTHKQWLAFLKKLDAETPGGLTLHLVLDHYGTHKHPKVKEWIERRNRRQRKEHGLERIVPRFTPTSSSWMNLVERFLRDLTVDCVRGGSFASVKELAAAIESYLQERDLKPVRHTWRASGADIHAKIKRARESQTTPA
jgi:transposase